MNKFCILSVLALVLLFAQETLQTSLKIRRAVSQFNRGYQCGARKRQVEGLITNGSNTKLGEWPWHGGLFRRKDRLTRKYTCGATLIHQNFVVTAGHCVVDRESGYELNAESLWVDFGYVQLFSSSNHGQSHAVQEIFVHPEFDKDNNKHDVALLSLKTAVRFSDYILPICVGPSTSDTSIRDIIGQQGVVVGWGLTENDETSSDLKLANLPVIDYAECVAADPDLFGKLVYPGMMCAGTRNGTSVCNGDSGGGMFVETGGRWTLRGITSFAGNRQEGSNKCDVNNYAGFMNVQYYASWINQIVPDLSDEQTTTQTTAQTTVRTTTTVEPIKEQDPWRDSAEGASRCVPNPCGRGANCHETGSRVCTCPDGYYGNPRVSCLRSGTSAECLENNECASSQECRQGRCVNACFQACGTHAMCRPRNHTPVCSCPSHMVGDPMVSCRSQDFPTGNNFGDCSDDFDCRDDQLCRRGNCVNACMGACGSNARCVARNHASTCSCPQNMVGDPWVSCRSQVSANPCVPTNPCGPGAICHVINEVTGSCQCPEGYTGNPKVACRRYQSSVQCMNNMHCPMDQICQQGNCVSMGGSYHHTSYSSFNHVIIN